MSNLTGFKYRDGFLPNLSAFAYTGFGYFFSLYGLTQDWWLIAALLLAHVMVISAYMIHECAHNNIFLLSENNERLGILLSWVVGASYSSYESLRKKHFRHHLERADILAVDFYAILQRHPLLNKAVSFLTFIYIPAVDLLLHGVVIIAPFVYPELKKYRRRILYVLLLRIAFFAWLAWLNPWALAGYALAYCLFLLVLNFMDAFQHTYEVYYELWSDVQQPGYDRDYEQVHTFSNLLSSRFPVLTCWYLISVTTMRITTSL